MQKSYLFSFFIIALLIFNGPCAVACLCLRENMAGYVNLAAIVFSGKVVEIQMDKSGARSRVKFEPSRIYKGNKQGPIIILIPDNNCRLEFKYGESYLVFGKLLASGEFTADLCSGTRILDDDALEEIIDFDRIDSAMPYPEIQDHDQSSGSTSINR